ncbi:hypothetical protein [Streptomyces sp. NPDC048496]|uniref:hypothetical protein n=1 Tax=Streptomyces sp. NPDC048496 TaxID=3365558 RepID=UPI00371E59D7
MRISAGEALDADNGFYRRYTLCSSGHMLGMDLHDCAQARADRYLDGRLEGDPLPPAVPARAADGRRRTVGLQSEGGEQ